MNSIAFSKLGSKKKKKLNILSHTGFTFVDIRMTCLCI